MILRRKRLPLFALAFGTVFNSVYAQTIERGLNAEIETALFSDDNIFRVTDELAESDFGFRFRPLVSFGGSVGKHTAGVRYTGDIAKYSENENADFDDHKFEGQIRFDHSFKFSTAFNIIYEDEHIDPGELDALRLDITEYDRFNRTIGIARATYGSNESIGSLSAEYRFIDRDYTNNDLDFLDSTINQGTLKFSYRLAPATRAYVQATFARSDFSPPEGLFENDNDYQLLKTGITWELTNLIEADVNAGYQQRDYDDELLQDIDGLAFDGTVKWYPTENTDIEFSAVRVALDSSLLEDAGGFVRTQFGTNIKHKLSDLSNVIIGFSYGEDDIFFAQNITQSRVDDRLEAIFSYSYSVRRNINVGTRYTYEDRSSDFELANFKSNLFELTLKLNFES